MGQKANPIGNRLGIIRGWESNWFGGKNMAQKVVEDEKIRNYLTARIPKGGVARIVIERTLKRITVSIQTSRPGIIIGKGGTEVDRIKEELKKLSAQEVQINILEIKIIIQIYNLFSKYIFFIPSRFCFKSNREIKFMCRIKLLSIPKFTRLILDRW